MMRRIVLAVSVTLVLAACASAVDVPKNHYGLPVITSAELYRTTVQHAARKELVDLASIPALRLDIRYATADNFMKQKLYESARAFLRRPAAKSIEGAQRDLAVRGLALKVFDAYRPYSITEKMWEPIRNPDYVADRRKDHVTIAAVRST